MDLDLLDVGSIGMAGTNGGPINTAFAATCAAAASTPTATAATAASAVSAVSAATAGASAASAPTSAPVGPSDSCFPPQASLPPAIQHQPNGCHSLAVPSTPEPALAVESLLLQQLAWPPIPNPFPLSTHHQQAGALPPSVAVHDRPSVPRPGLTLDVSAAALLSSPDASSSSSASTSSLASSATSAASSHFALGNPCFSAVSATAPAPAPPPTSASCAPASALITSPLSARRAGRVSPPRSGARPKKPAMSSGRASSKRLGERGDSSGDDSPAPSAAGSQQAVPGKTKPPRPDRAVEDFSSVVKNRLQSYTRTGQACDRCKVRKIRCDALPEGCSHCINLKLDCFVTDRLSGRTERRGYMQELERDKNGMVSRIRELEKLLQENGVEVKPYQEEKADSGTESSEPPPSEPETSEWAQIGSLWVKNYTKKKTYSPRFPRSQLESRSESKGTVAGRPVAPLNMMRGTKLTFLGTTIDTSSFPVPDVDEPEDPNDTTPLYNKSAQAFVQTAMGVNPLVHVDLPSRQEAFTYADWYFMTIGAFIPVLHRPTFMKLLTSMYDDPDFQPTAAQTAQVHTVFAIILFQYGVRNWQQADQRHHLNDLSNKHFHLAASKWHHLLLSRDLEALQALALLVSHVRQFPKLGCGSMVAQAVLQRAIDFNLHRNLAPEGGQTNLVNEMRKRLWWGILMNVVSITGRRGYPMPIAVEEMDTEFPEPIADELLSDDGVDTSRTLPCPYEPAIAGFKITPIFMETYSNIHSVRGDPDNYVTVVKALEEQLQKWEDELPESLRVDEAAPVDIQMLAPLFMRTYVLELRLSLRHPGVAMTTDPQMIADNTRICADTAREFLGVAKKLHTIKCLDTTWYTVSFSSACIFAMLVAQWEKRFQTTEPEYVSLREDMASWMSILEEIGLVLDAKISITDETRRIIERTLSWIRHDMNEENDKKKSSGKPNGKKPKSQNKQRSASLPRKQAAKPNPSPVDEPAAAPAHAQQAPQQPMVAQAPEMMDPANKEYYPNHSMAAQQTYQAMAYGGQPNMDHAGYQSDVSLMYNNSANAAQMGGDSSVPSNPLIAFASQAAQAQAQAQVQAQAQHMPPHTEAEYMWHSRGNTWQDWTAAIADTNDRYSANALLTLGGGAMQHQPQPAPAPDQRDGGGMDSSLLVGQGMGMGQQGGMHPSAHGQTAQWPMMMFDSHPATSG